MGDAGAVTVVLPVGPWTIGGTRLTLDHGNLQKPGCKLVVTGNRPAHLPHVPANAL
jgi:hypothetical protein